MPSTSHDNQPDTVTQLRGVLKEERDAVRKLFIAEREHTREIIRVEVGRQLDVKLEPVHQKLDRLIETEDEDVRAVAGDVERVKRALRKVKRSPQR